MPLPRPPSNFLAPAPLTDQNAQGELDWGRQLYQRCCIDLPFLEGGRPGPAGCSWTPLSAKGVGLPGTRGCLLELCREGASAAQLERAARQGWGMDDWLRVA